MDYDTLKVANRRVLVGPLASKLAKRQTKLKRRQYALAAFAALAIFTIALGAFFLQRQPTPSSSASLESNGAVPVQDTGTTSRSTMLDPVAVESTQPEPSVSQVTGPAEDETAHVAFVVPEPEKKEAIEDFLEKLNDSPEAENLIDLVSENDSQVEETDEDGSPREWHEATEPIKPLVEERALTELLARQPDLIRSDANELTASQAELDRTKSDLQSDVTAQAVVVEAPLVLATNHQRVETEVSTPTTIGATAMTPSAVTRKSHVPIKEALHLETLVDTPDLVERDLVAEELGVFRDALDALEADLDDRVAAQHVYASASSLSRLYCEQPDARISEELQVLRRPNFVRLVSSATKSWMKWSARQIDGVVTGGIVQSVSTEGSQTVVRLETYDARSSVLVVALDERDNYVVGEGEEVVVLGCILLNDRQDTPEVEIRGFVLPVQDW